MCTFISATLNADADPSLVQTAFEDHGFRFVDAPPHKDLPAARRYLAHDSGHCDCGTALGSGWHEEKPPYTPEEIAKLRKKNWSRAKIERWKAQKLDAEAKDARANRDRLEAAHRDLASWVGLVRALLATPTVNVFGLMHDWYSSGPGTEELPLVVEPPQPLASLTEERLFRLPGGVLLKWTL